MKYSKADLTLLCDEIIAHGDNVDLKKLKNINPCYIARAIQSYKHIQNGEKYTQTLNEYVTRYFFNHIFKNCTKQEKSMALFSLAQHISYYENNARKGKITMQYLRQIYDEFSKK